MYHGKREEIFGLGRRPSGQQPHLPCSVQCPAGTIKAWIPTMHFTGNLFDASFPYNLSVHLSIVYVFKHSVSVQIVNPIYSLSPIRWSSQRLWAFSTQKSSHAVPTWRRSEKAKHSDSCAKQAALVFCSTGPKCYLFFVQLRAIEISARLRIGFLPADRRNRLIRV